MGSVVLVVLVLAWAVLLLPAILRRRAERGSRHSIADFHQKLASIHARRGEDSVPGRPVGSFASVHPVNRRASATVARSRARRAQRRRRDIFMGLFAAMIGSAGLALVPGFHVLWMLHAVIDVCLLGYVALLLRMRTAGARRVAPQLTFGHRADEGGYDLGFAYARAAND